MIDGRADTLLAVAEQKNFTQGSKIALINPAGSESSDKPT